MRARGASSGVLGSRRGLFGNFMIQDLCFSEHFLRGFIVSANLRNTCGTFYIRKLQSLQISAIRKTSIDKCRAEKYRTPGSRTSLAVPARFAGGCPHPPYKTTSLGGPFMRGVAVGWVPPLTPPLNKRPPPKRKPGGGSGTICFSLRELRSISMFMSPI